MKKWHFALALVTCLAVAMVAGPVMAGPEKAPNGPIADLLQRVGELELSLTALVQRVSDAETGIEEQRLPEGAIIMWSGEIDENGHPVIDETANTDWWLCDGENGTPDLTDQFVIGAGNTYEVGDSGGSNEQTLIEGNLPSHTHGVSLSTSTAGDHVHYAPDVGYLVRTKFGDCALDLSPTTVVYEVHYRDWSNEQEALTSSAGAHTHSVTGSTAATGGGTEFSIMPPYYALAYIMYMPG